MPVCPNCHSTNYTLIAETPSTSVWKCECGARFDHPITVTPPVPVSDVPCAENPTHPDYRHNIKLEGNRVVLTHANLTPREGDKTFARVGSSVVTCPALVIVCPNGIFVEVSLHNNWILFEEPNSGERLEVDGFAPIRAEER